MVLNEPGSEAVEAALHDSVMSAANVTECVAIMIRRGLSYDHASEIIQKSGARIIPLTFGPSAEAGLMHDKTRSFGLSYMDCICLVLAADMNAPVLTADKIWAELDLEIEVRVVR